MTTLYSRANQGEQQRQRPGQSHETDGDTGPPIIAALDVFYGQINVGADVQPGDDEKDESRCQEKSFIDRLGTRHRGHTRERMLVQVFGIDQKKYA